RRCAGDAARRPQRRRQPVMRTEITDKRDKAPPGTDGGGGAEGARERARARGRAAGGGGGGGGGRFGRRRRHLLEALHELADVFLERGQLADQGVDLLEVGDDLAFYRLALRATGHRLDAMRDLLVRGPEGRQRRIDHQAFAVSFTAVSSATFSFDVSSRAVLSTMIVRPSFTTRPVMYSAARPFTIPGGEVI